MLTFFVYTLLIMICVFGWFSTKSYNFSENRTKISLSLVVCCRNEQENLPLLLRSIENQVSDIEQIVFVNDNSGDRTFEILQEFEQTYQLQIGASGGGIKVFSTKNFGKKNALIEAMQMVENEYVLCVDADCVVPKNYFALVKKFLAKNQPDLMIGGVVLSAKKQESKDSILALIQQLEFASLQASGAGAALAGMPIMCNGANLAFRKEIWQNADNHLVMHEISGDDVFLLHYIKKIGGKIVFLKNKNAFVQTFPVENIKNFFRQRERWASKSKSYSDWQTIFAALIVFSVNFLIIFSAFGAFFSKILLAYFFTIFLSKMLIDSILLTPFLIFSKQKKLIKFIPILSVFYPFYIVFTAIFGIFGKTLWK